MNDRTHALRQQSLDAVPTITPVLRGRAFAHLCEHKTIYIGDGELIVGERGPEPKAVPTFRS
jgi:hypothetical protein